VDIIKRRMFVVVNRGEEKVAWKEGREGGIEGGKAEAEETNPPCLRGSWPRCGCGGGCGRRLTGLGP